LPDFIIVDSILSNSILGLFDTVRCLKVNYKRLYRIERCPHTQGVPKVRVPNYVLATTEILLRSNKPFLFKKLLICNVDSFNSCNTLTVLLSCPISTA